MQYYLPVLDDLVRMEQWDLARKLIDTITPYAPSTLEGYDTLSALNFKAKRYEIAIAWGEKALPLAIDSHASRAVRFNLGKCYNAANYPDKALRVLGTNVRLDPDDLDSGLDYAVALFASGRKQEANQFLLDLRQRPGLDSKAKDTIDFNLGTHLLADPNTFHQGLRNLAIGRKLRIWGAYVHNYTVPKWDGEPDPGARLLVVGEGGIGDCLINARFIRHIEERGLTASWADNHNLGTILSRVGYSEVIPYQNLTALSTEVLSRFDYWVPAMDLPLILGVGEQELWDGPYLTVANPDIVQARRDRLHTPQGPSTIKRVFTIGLRWSGNVLYEQDLHRSIPIGPLVSQLVAKLKEMSGKPERIRFISLQKDACQRDQLEVFDAITDVDPKYGMMLSSSPISADDCDTFDDTLTLIGECDVVISSCTSVAHASAALGIPTYILTPIMAYYVWANGKQRSPWYDTDDVKIFHQKTPRDWSESVQELVDTLVQDMAITAHVSSY